MPIPTDTYWNIKKLNVVFAASAVILVLVTLWAIFQDFNQGWREPQRQGKIWQAALVSEKIERDNTPELQAKVEELQKQQAQLSKQLGPDTPRTKELIGRLNQLKGEQAKMEFKLNNDKAVLGVKLTGLQDAMAAGDKAKVRELERDIAAPQKDVDAQTEALAAKKDQVAAAQKELSDQTAPLDAVTKQITKLQTDIEALRKKRESLVPKGLIANVSEKVRDAPLMQFINPAEKVQPLFVNDVLTSLGGVKEVITTDKCVTCHVNIANKDFTEPKVLAYLEEQVATSRNYVLPDVPPSATGAAATKAAPGAVAMPEFWHLYAVRVAPEVVKKPANLNRISTLAKTVGKPATVTINGKPLATFNYVPDPKKPEDAASAALDPAMRDQVVAELLRAWVGYGSGRKSSGPVKVELPADLKDVVGPRTAAMKYVEEVRAGLVAAVTPDVLHQINDKYRRALVAEANKGRRKEGYKDLDPSPVLLAHPRLDLYVDADSKHDMNAVGCTSCHDGSGQETDFVVAAHSPRPIWVDSKTGEPVLPGQIDPQSVPASHHGATLASMMAAVYPHDALVPEPVKDIHLEVGEHKSTTQPAAEHKVVPVEAPSDVHVASQTPPLEYVNPITGQIGRAVPQMKYWMAKYEPSAPRGFELVYHEWDWPMRPPKYLQANCVRCHQDVNSIKNEAPQVFEGRSLFVNLGCANCHQMDAVPAETTPNNPSDVRLIVANGQRKVGTDLRNITAKLSPAYINTWIWAPKAFRPSTKMPHFFMLENNSSAEEIRRTRQEARSITEYLVRTADTYTSNANMAVADASGSTPPIPSSTQPAEARPLPPKHIVPPNLKPDAAAGKAIFNGIGCQGCHTNLNDQTTEKRAGKAITIGEKWIVTDLAKGGKLAKQMEEETGKAPTTSELTKRATEMYDHMSYNEKQLYCTENLAPDYTGVAPKYPDNTIKPLFQHHGPELSGIGTKLTAGGRTVEQARTWLFDWLKEPRHYSEYTVMPQLRLTDQQALDLTEYLLNQKRTNTNPDDPWQAHLTEPDTGKLVELTGLFLVSRYSFKTAMVKANDDAELTALATDALTTANKSSDAAKAEVARMSKDQKRMVFLGKKLIANYGCMSCHAINGAENLSSPCANLSDWGQKGVDKLDFGYLDPHKVHDLPEKSAVPMVNGLCAKAALLTGEDFNAVAPEGKVVEPVDVGWPHVEHSRTSWITQKLKNTRAYDRGKALLEPGKDPIEPDRQTTGRPYDKLKMPTFYLSDKEVDAIVTWVISNRDRLITQKLANATMTEQSQRIARGRQLVQKYNCVACHVIEGNQPSVQQYYDPSSLATTAPPSLRGEGNKIQHTWLFNFLKHVEPLRPLLYSLPDTKPGIRMPSFPILDDEATAIAAYFNAESVHESRDLKKEMIAVAAYKKAQQEAAMKSVTPPKNPTTVPSAEAKPWVDAMIVHAGAQIADKDHKGALETLTSAEALATAAKLSEPTGTGATTRPVSTRLKDAITALKEDKVPDAIPWPGDDWYQRPEMAQWVQDLREWALANKLINELQIDPTKNKPAELAKSYRLILFRSTFVQELFDAPYPFVETPRPDIDDARFAKGEKMFYEMQCLKCHVLGDPSVAGANKTPTAPNLTLAHRRLQRRWVRHWVQEPPIIQPGTAMPPFFSGGPDAATPAWDPHGQSWPRAQKTERPPEAIEADYGKTVDEQTNLLLDFLYAAGVRGFTGIQPATPPAPKTPPTPTPAKAPEAPKASATPPAPKAEVKTPEAPAAKTPAGGGGSAGVKGKVVLDGKAPVMPVINMAGVPDCAKQHADPVTEQTFVVGETGELKNVVVYVSSGLKEQSFDPPAEAAVLNQHGCMYEPHVLPVMVGQKIMIKNSDSFLHNVHALTDKNPPFNFGQPTVDDGKPVDPLKTSETFRVKCDVHTWMSAYIVGLDNPYFAVSGDDGTFAIPNLPPGEYTLTAWHESLGSKEIPVKVEAGKPTDVQVKFAAP